MNDEQRFAEESAGKKGKNGEVKYRPNMSQVTDDGNGAFLLSWLVSMGCGG
jgi:hypothetical protein